MEAGWYLLNYWTPNLCNYKVRQCWSQMRHCPSVCIYWDFDNSSSLPSLERNVFVPLLWHLLRSSRRPLPPLPNVRHSSLMALVILLMSNSCISFLISPWISWEKLYSVYEGLYFVRQLHCTISFASTSDSLSTHCVMGLSLSVWNTLWCVYSQSLMPNFTSGACNTVHSSRWQ